MTPLLSPALASGFLAVFAVAMLTVTWFFGRHVGTKSTEGFLVAGRRVPWWIAGASIAASWTWAVALMVSVQMAYEQGFAGIFWFTTPNVLAVLIYIWLGPRIRERLPTGYSLPEWIHTRFGDRRTTTLYIIIYFYYQIMAVAVQVYAGAQLLSLASGIPTKILMPTVLVIVLTYTLISGLEASIVTDFLQLSVMLFIGWATVAMVIRAASGSMSFTGVSEAGGLNPFDPKIALTYGVITSIGLLSGSICDQQFWQRCFAIRAGDLKKSFLFGALLFSTIPISLALLGFTAASPDVDLLLSAEFDPALIGLAVVGRLLPAGFATVFLFVLLAGLSSTLDSGLSASASLRALVRQKPWGQSAPSRDFSMTDARLTMVATGLAGLAIAFVVELLPGFGLQYLWFFFNTIAACMVVPTVLSLFWEKLTAQGVLVGSGLGLLLGLPLVIYASLTAKNALLAASYVGLITLSTISCILLAKRTDES